MELKEYIRIIIKNINVFLAVIAAVVVAGFAIVFFKPVSYTTSMLIDVTRSGTQDTADYKYDDFYRIQADEKFVQTIVQWISNPGIESDILSGAGSSASNLSLRQLSNSFRAQELSSQAISVTFSTPTRDQAQKIAASITNVITKNTAALNADQKEGGWFEIVAHYPVIVEDLYGPLLVLLVTLVLGIFLAFWVVLIIHYLK